MVLSYETMKRILVAVPLFISMLMFDSCGSSSNTQARENDSQPVATETAPNGEQIYRANCIVCHGKDGAAGMSGATDLSKSVLSHEQTVDVITNGRGGMRGFTELSSTEIEAVATYVESLRK